MLRLRELATLLRLHPSPVYMPGVSSELMGELAFRFNATTEHLCVAHVHNETYTMIVVSQRQRVWAMFLVGADESILYFVNPESYMRRELGAALGRVIGPGNYYWIAH